MTELEVLQEISLKLDTNTSAITDLITQVNQIEILAESIKVFMIIMIGIMLLIFFYSRLKTFGGAFK